MNPLNGADVVEVVEPSASTATPEQALSAAQATLAFAIGEAAQAAGQVNVIALMTRAARLECQQDGLMDVLGADPELKAAYCLAATKRLLELAEKLRDRPRLQLAKTLQ